DDTHFKADGAGAVLNLPTLASLGHLQSYLHFQAFQGGQINAAALASIASPAQQGEYLDVDADGAGSLIVLSGLTSPAVTNGYITASNSGQVTLNTGTVGLAGFNISVTSAGTITAGTLRLLPGSTLSGNST